MTSEKICFKCQRSLTTDQFYRHSQMADGLLGKCKECTKKDAKANRDQNIEMYRAYDLERSKSEKRRAAAKIYAQSEAGKAVQLKASRLNAKKDPQRVRARATLNRALRSGKLEKQPCFICGDFAEAHHPDYSAPLNVTWLCKKHHTEVHLLAKELNKQT